MALRAETAACYCHYYYYCYSRRHCSLPYRGARMKVSIVACCEVSAHTNLGGSLRLSEYGKAFSMFFVF